MSGRKIIDGAKEALAIVRGEAAPARLYIDPRARHDAFVKDILRRIRAGEFETTVVRRRLTPTDPPHQSP